MNKIDEKAAELRSNLAADMDLDDETKSLLGQIDMKVATGYTLADAMREGSTVSRQEVGGWGDGETACALTAASIAAKARGYIS
jgi:hypothetical protein